MVVESAPQALLSIKDVSKAFPGVKALDRVSLEVSAGVVHGIVGENGAGKSTLMKILSGVYEKDSGEIVYEGQVIDKITPIEIHETRPGHYLPGTEPGEHDDGRGEHLPGEVQRVGWEARRARQGPRPPRQHRLQGQHPQADGSRRWLVDRRRIGPVIRAIEAATDPLFRRAGLVLE